MFIDYSRSFPENLTSLIERYGEIKGFKELKTLENFEIRIS